MIRKGIQGGRYHENELSFAMGAYSKVHLKTTTLLRVFVQKGINNLQDMEEIFSRDLNDRLLPPIPTCPVPYFNI